MTAPSGQISFNDVNVELKLSGTAMLGLDDPLVRYLAGKASGTIGLNDIQGKTYFVAPTATGGTIYTDSVGGWKYHIFTTSGTFAITNMGTVTSIDFICVAGGGGARGDTGSGGGAGGYVQASGNPGIGSWAIIPGGGGSGAGGTGTQTTGMGLIAKGGGGGTNVGGGQAGGSGAGASASGSGGAATQPGTAQSPVSGLTVTQNLGNAGGSGIGGGTYYPGAGGGGAGGAGQGSNNSGTGAGGAAYDPGWTLPASQLNASASVLAFSGGGGGGCNTGGVNNAGGTNAGRGGGTGAAGTNGLAYFGGGAGGSGWTNGTTTSGGSGVFLVRYRIAA